MQELLQKLKWHRLNSSHDWRNGSQVLKIKANRKRIWTPLQRYLSKNAWCWGLSHKTWIKLQWPGHLILRLYQFLWRQNSISIFLTQHFKSRMGFSKVRFICTCRNRKIVQSRILPCSSFSLVLSWIFSLWQLWEKLPTDDLNSLKHQHF